MTLDTLKLFEEVVMPDPRWQALGRSLAGHHTLVAGVTLIASVPMQVRQHFETARNAWLYAYFAYRLLGVAMLTLLVACEAAVTARAEREGVALKGKVLRDLLALAIERRWVTDAGFAAAADRAPEWERRRAFLQAVGQADIGAWPGPANDQEISKHVVAMIREMRNALAHGDGPLWPNVSHEFQAGADFINQLFPPLQLEAKP